MVTIYPKISVVGLEDEIDLTKFDEQRMFIQSVDYGGDFSYVTMGSKSDDYREYIAILNPSGNGEIFTTQYGRIYSFTSNTLRKIKIKTYGLFLTYGWSFRGTFIGYLPNRINILWYAGLEKLRSHPSDSITDTTYWYTSSISWVTVYKLDLGMVYNISGLALCRMWQGGGVRVYTRIGFSKDNITYTYSTDNNTNSTAPVPRVFIFDNIAARYFVLQLSVSATVGTGCTTLDKLWFFVKV